MWILNQKQNRFLEVKDIWKGKTLEGKYSIEATTFKGTEVRLGKYDSKEKADEVLRMIFSSIKKGIEVYEMPSEEEELEKITPEQLENEFRDMCKVLTCKFCEFGSESLDLDHCRWRFLLENYYVTRK